MVWTEHIAAAWEEGRKHRLTRRAWKLYRWTDLRADVWPLDLTFFAILPSLGSWPLNFLTTPLNAYQSFFRWRLVLTLSGFLFPLAAFGSSPSTHFASAFLTSYWLNVLPSQAPNGGGNSSWCHWILSSVALSPLQRQQQEKSTNVYVKKKELYISSSYYANSLSGYHWRPASGNWKPASVNTNQPQKKMRNSRV